MGWNLRANGGRGYARFFPTWQGGIPGNPRTEWRKHPRQQPIIALDGRIRGLSNGPEHPAALPRLEENHAEEGNHQQQE